LFSAALNLNVGAQSSGQVTSSIEDTWSAVCSSKIEHPLYPTAAILSRLAGSVSADLVVERNGKAAAVTLSGPAPFADTVRAAIGGTTFPASCTGRSLKVTFSFQIKADLPAQYYVSACFSHPPNIFSVTADGIEIICSHYAYLGALVGPEGMTPITVCELLANPVAYDGKNVALLGRLDDSHFDGRWLSEDNCGSRLITDQHVWPNRVWIGGAESAPTPSTGILVVDPDALDRKLESVRRTTALKMEEVTFYGNNGLGTRLMKQNWAMIFGRIEAREQLRPPSGAFPNRDWGNGFGQMNSAPVQIIRKQENEFYIQETASGK
jgi:hypothetical protein